MMKEKLGALSPPVLKGTKYRGSSQSDLWEEKFLPDLKDSDESKPECKQGKACILVVAQNPISGFSLPSQLLKVLPSVNKL